MDIVQLIEEIEDLIEDAGSVPFSKKVMVDADELYDIIHEMRQNLPEEIKQAAWITEERERILSEAQREADVVISEAEKESERIVEEARQKFEGMVNEHEVVIEARNKAQSLQAKAEQAARTMKIQSITYVDDILAQTQERLKGVLNVLEDNREELRKN